jgi:subfamily B ATP-binding cassette protein MsbA
MVTSFLSFVWRYLHGRKERGRPRHGNNVHLSQRILEDTRIHRPALVLAGALALAFPFLFSSYQVNIMTTALMYAVLGLGLNIVVGLAGLLDLGYVAFYAVGAYSYALLNKQFGLGFWTALPAGMGLAATFGILLGFPVLRLRGDYLAIVTLGFGEIIRIFLNNLNRPVNITNGPLGITLIEPIRLGDVSLSQQHTIAGLAFAPVHSYYYVFLAFVLLSIVISLRLEDSRIGRAWIAIREDEIAAKSMGIHTRNVKLLAFAMGASFGGVSGGLFAAFQGFVSPESFALLDSIMILCMVVLSLSTAAYANLLGPALEFLFTGQVKALGALRNFVPDGVDFDAVLATLDRRAVLTALPFIIIAVALVKGLATYGQFYIMAMVSQRMVADLRCTLVDKLLSLSPAYYGTRSTGDLLARVSGDVWSVDAAVTGALPSYVRDGLTLVVMLANCFILDWRMSLVVFCGVPIALWPVLRLTKRLKALTVKAAADSGMLTATVQEALAGIRVVQAFGMERFESRRYVEQVDRYLRLVRRSYRVRAISSPLMEVMGAVGIAAAIWWVGGRILANEIEPGKFFTFIAAVMLLYQPVKQLGRVGQTAIAGVAAAERIYEVLDARSPVEDTGTRVLPPFREAIRFERIGFSYDGERPVLRDFDLEIRRGEVVALVGAAGGGKTTVANLLPRFWDPGSGRVTIDGVDLREATLASVRAQISLVTQETVLFNDTVRANIAYGRPDLPLAQVERAARLADAHDFIVAMPRGYDTVVGERGSSLSGGQRQRIAIARAFLKDAPILVLDEATSALDTQTERLVQEALERLEEGRTTVAIAHRLSTVRNADQIVVLDGGRPVERGTHEELMALGGRYAGLVARDARAEDALATL